MRSRIAVALALVPLAAAAGCGGGGGGGDNSSDSNGIESKSATQVLSDSAAALKKVKSFHVEATQGSRDNKVVADVEVPATLRLVIREGAASASIIALDGSVYIRANRAYWKGQQNAAAAAKLAGKWLKSPTSGSELRDISKGLDPETLSRCLSTGHGTISKGGTTTIDGQKALVLIDKGDRPGTTPGKLYVATTGDPLPLRTLSTGNQRPGGTKDPQCNDRNRARTGDEAKFSNYNEPPDVTAPPGAIDVGTTGSSS